LKKGLLHTSVFVSATHAVFTTVVFGAKFHTLGLRAIHPPCDDFKRDWGGSCR